MLRHLSVLLAASFLLLLTVAVEAQPDPAELRCGAAGTSTQDVERCLKQALDEAEAMLSQAQEQLRQALRAAQPKFEQLKEATMAVIEGAMSKAQQAWREFFDRNCGYYGQLHRAIGEESKEELACQLRMVRARTQELQQEAKFWREKAPAITRDP